MSKKENIMACYFMPRDLSMYGGNFCIEDINEESTDEYRAVFINKPDWCNDFEMFWPGNNWPTLYSFKVKEFRMVPLDGVVVQAIAYNKESANEYQSLKAKLFDIAMEQEVAQSDGTWQTYMASKVESLESLRERGAIELDLKGKDD